MLYPSAAEWYGPEFVRDNAAFLNPHISAQYGDHAANKPARAGNNEHWCLILLSSFGN